MASFDTTSTMAIRSDTTLDEAFPTATESTMIHCDIQAASPGRQRILLSGVLPTQPLGADSISRVTLALTYLFGTVTLNHVVNCHQLNTKWSGGNESWNNYAAALAWTNAGGDVGNFLASTRVTPAVTRSATFSWDITPLNLSWQGRYNVLLKLSDETVTQRFAFISTDSATPTFACLPHAVVTYVNNPPPAITDLTVSPDLSLTESSFSYRQRPVLKWTTSNASDFARYRVRFGINRTSPANLTTRALITSRGSNSYLDPTLYTDGSTVSYAVYPEDNMNQSASTNANISNVISWTKPAATVGRVSPSSSASTLGLVEVDVRGTQATNIAKAKIVWGDGGYSFTSNRTSGAGYLFANHRYSKTGTVTIRGLVEDIFGFRSSPDTYATGYTISNLGPVARLVASPSRHMEMRKYPEWARDYRPASYEPPEDGRHYDIHLERRHRRNTMAFNPVFSGDPPMPIDIRTVAAGFLCPCGEAPHTVLTDLAQYEDIPQLLFAENLKIHLQRFGGPEAIDAMDRSWFRSRVVDDEPVELAEAKLIDSSYSWEAFHPDSVIDRDSLHDYAAYCKKQGVMPSLDDFLRHSITEDAFRVA